MANDFYQRLHDYVPFTKARAEHVKDEFDAIEVAFDKMPSIADILSGNPFFLEATGTGDAMAADNLIPWDTYVDKGGYRLSVKVPATNTNSVTINIDDLGPRPVRRNDGVALIAGDLVGGGIYDMIYDADEAAFKVQSAWQGLITQAGISASTAESAANTAVGAANSAEEDAGTASSAASTATGAANAAGEAAGEAEAARDLAEKWASEAEDVPVEGGEYSAKHYAAKAQTWDPAGYVPNAREIEAGDGLTGGGDLSENRSMAVDKASAANIRSGASNKIIDAEGVYSASAPVSTSGSGSWVPDLNAGRVFQRTLTGNSTLANPTNQKEGQQGLIYIIQDGTGGRALTFGSDWKHLNEEPEIDTTANAVNVFAYYVRASGNVTLSYLGIEV